MHELTVVAHIVSKADPEVAVRFLSHAAISAAKNARAYERHHERLNLEPSDQRQIEQLEADRQLLRQRYGGSFHEDWGWAAPLVPNQSRGFTFSDLEEVSGLGFLRPYYLHGCHRVHGGSMGVELGLIEFRGQTILAAGPSHASLTDVGHGSLISLANVTISLLCERINENPMNFTVMPALLELTDPAGTAFLAAHQAPGTVGSRTDPPDGRRNEQ
jgi:hypothetical protein